MMGSRSFGRVVLALLLASLLVCSLSAIAESQSIQQSPYSAANTVRSGPFGGLDLAPSNPFGQPGSLAPAGPQSLYVSDGMLRALMPLVPNLQFGYLYDFGSNRVNQGRATADYLLPFSLNANSEVFGEAHSEFENFWNTFKSTFSHGNTTTYENGFNNRVDLSLGGGFRSFVRRDTLLGVNGFYDTSRLGERWYSSGGLGLEMAALVGGNDAIDLNFNWYGKLLNGNVIRNAFRYGPSNFDFQAGYSHELCNGGPDFRLSATGYKFDIGESVWGWNAGAELKTRDNMFVLKYAVGNDKVDRTYQTIGGFVNVGFQLENLFSGESPFTKPEPIFHSLRNLRYMLTRKVDRNWHQPSGVVVSRASAQTSPAALTLLWTSTVDLSRSIWKGNDRRNILNPPPPGLLASATSMTITISGFGADSVYLYVELSNHTTPDSGGQFGPINFSAGSASFTTSDPAYWTFSSGPDSPLGVDNPNSSPGELNTPAGATMTITWH
jgi:hypothetical protein